MDINLVMYPEIETLKKTKQNKTHQPYASWTRCCFESVEKNRIKKSHCLELSYSQEISSITRFLNLHHDHLTRGKKTRFHTGEHRIV